MLEPVRSTRRPMSPHLKSALAALLFGGVVAVTLVPGLAEALSSPGVILLTVIGVALAVTLRLGRMVRLNRTTRARAVTAADARRDTVLEISRLEEMHELPAYEPNRSTYTRKSTLS